MMKKPFVQIPYRRTYSSIALLYRLFLAFLFFFLARLIFYGANAEHFRHLHFDTLCSLFVGGIRFDTTALLYVNAPFLLAMLLPVKWRARRAWRVATDWLFLIPNILALFINLADTVYYPFTLKRSTTLVFSEFEHEGGSLVLHLLATHLLWIVVAILLAFLMIFLYRRVRVDATLLEDRSPWIYYPIHTLLMLVVAGLSVAGIRGGFTGDVRPITLSNAAAYVDRPEDCALVLNTPFCLIRTIGKAPLKELHYYPNEADASEVFSPYKLYSQEETPMFGIARGRNVVVVIIESFAREFVGMLNQDIPGYSGYTPSFDSLAKEAYVFKRAFANGRKSIDAMPSILASLPSLGQHFILSHYSSNNINTLANCLGSRGYSSMFFHGAPNGSMGFDAFTRQCGYKGYFGKTEYAKDSDFDGYWGIWDEPFLQRMSLELGKLPQPFLGTVFTLSSHHPFHVPKAYEGRFPKGKVPLIQCIGYTDHALGAFFRSASKQPWFANTLFVIVADHASQSALPRYQTPTGIYAIPIMFYAPGLDLKGLDDTTVAQQADIFPTLLALLGYDKPFISFGSNLFDKEAPHFAINNMVDSDIIQLIEGAYSLEFDGKSAVGLYQYQTDPEQKANLLHTQPDVAHKMTRLVQSVLQQYNARMIHNRLTTP